MPWASEYCIYEFMPWHPAIRLRGGDRKRFLSVPRFQISVSPPWPKDYSSQYLAAIAWNIPSAVLGSFLRGGVQIFDDFCHISVHEPTISVKTLHLTNDDFVAVTSVTMILWKSLVYSDKFLDNCVPRDKLRTTKLFIAPVSVRLPPYLLMILHSVTAATFHAGHEGDKNSQHTAFQLNWPLTRCLFTDRA